MMGRMIMASLISTFSFILAEPYFGSVGALFAGVVIWSVSILVQ